MQKIKFKIEKQTVNIYDLPRNFIWHSIGYEMDNINIMHSLMSEEGFDPGENWDAWISYLETRKITIWREKAYYTDENRNRRYRWVKCYDLPKANPASWKAYLESWKAYIEAEIICKATEQVEVKKTSSHRL